MNALRKIVLAGFAAVSLLSSIAASFAQSPTPVPALPDVERRTTYNLTASICACSLGSNLALYGDGNDFQNWVEVFINGVQVQYNDPAYGWTITSPTGPLASIPRPVTDGVLTFTNVQTGTIQIVGARRPRRVSQFNENTGVPARNLNQALTDIVAQNRETWDKINDVTGRAVLAAPGETLALLPAKASRANQGACFDANGNLINCVSIPSSTFTAGSNITLTGSNPTAINVSAGPANTFKGSLNGTATSDIALTACNLAYQVTKWVAGTGWQCGINPVIPSRAIAATLNLSAYNTITVQGYYTGGDGGFMTMTKVGSQPFCGNFTNTAAFQDAGSNWWNISEPFEYNFLQFGATFNWAGTDGSAHDDTADVQSALYCAGVSLAPGTVANTGADGKLVRAPSGQSLISSTIIHPEGVVVQGNGTFSSVFVMAQAFPTNAHMWIEGEQFQQNDIALVQSGSAGNLNLNGARVRSGVAYTIASRGYEICSANNNSGVTFTITGIGTLSGTTTTETITGPTAGNCVFSTKGWLQISQIAANAAYILVTAGYNQVPTFSARLQDLQLFSNLNNATTFSTIINCCGSSTAGVTGGSYNAMLYTNSAQHTAGFKNIKVLAGNRSAFVNEVGVGGASYITAQDLEADNSGNLSGVASNNPIVILGYGGLAVPLSDWVISGCGASCSPSNGVEIVGGFVAARNVHFEGLTNGFLINFLPNSANTGSLFATGLSGNGSTTNVVNIQSGQPSSNYYICHSHPLGATNIVNNQGTPVTGNIIGCNTY